MRFRKEISLEQATPPADRKTVLVVASISSFLAPFMSASLNIATPAIGREFGMPAVLLGWIATASLLAAAVCLVPFGKIADMKGRKKIFGWGSFVFALSSSLSIFSGSTVVFLASRVLQGIGSAMIFSTGIAMLTSVYPPGERGRVLGINVSFTYFGLSLGPVLGGGLTQNLGWRSIFAFNAVLGFGLVVLVVWKLKGEEWAEALGEKFDWIGSMVMAIGLVALMLGLGRLPAAWGGILIAFSIIAFAVFVVWEKKSPSPVLDIGLFRENRVFAFSNLAALINYSATAGGGFLLSLYLQYIKGFSPQTAGLVLLAQPAMMVLFSPLAGRFSDRIEPRILASTGMGVSAAGLLMLAGLGPETSTGLIVGALLVLGFGFALFSSPNTNAVMGAVEKRFYGVASAMLGTMRLSGQMLSLGLVMLTFSLVIGRAQIIPEVYPQFLSASRVAFFLFAALSLGGVFASLARGRIHTQKKGEETK